MMLSLFAARRGKQVLTIDLDPECGTSRDFLGKQLPGVKTNLKSLLESPLPLPPPVLPSGIEGVDIVPCAPDEQRFFRLFPEKSTKLRESLDLLPPTYDWILLDTPNQFDNVAELGLIAANYLIMPVELTADCVERVPTALRIINEARAFNPSLAVLGVLGLASVPRNGQPLGLSAKERLIFREYEEAFKQDDITLFNTIMSSPPLHAKRHRTAQQNRTPATANA
jgi:cellulose biosynthesis protein BcsQ